MKKLYKIYYKENSKTRTCIDTLNIEKLLEYVCCQCQYCIYLYHTIINFYNMKLHFKTIALLRNFAKDAIGKTSLTKVSKLFIVL